MEFNNKQITTATTSTSEVVADKVTLTSPERVSVASINTGIKVSTTLSDANTVLIAHDTRDLKALYNKDVIKTSLVNIYGKNSRIAASSKDVEAISIPISEFPARLEYTFTIIENNVPVEYKTDYLIPTKDTTTILPISGKKLSSTSEMSVPEAVVKIDEDLVNIKNNLQKFSFVYDINQNKSVSLHDFIINLSTKLDTIAKDLENVKEKVKDL